MKKIIKILFAIVFIITIIILYIILRSAKNKNVFLPDEYKMYTITCDISTSDIINMNFKYFLTSEGDIYKYNLTKKYSNEQNCKKIESKETFIKMIETNNSSVTLLESNNHNLYRIESNLITEFYGDNLDEYSVEKHIYKLYEEYPNLFNFSSFNYNQNTTFLSTIENNIIYEFLINTDGSYQKTETSQISSDETILSAYSRIIKTNKKYYSLGITNKEKCNNYADVSCDYGVVSLDEFNGFYDDINNIFFSGGTTYFIIRTNEDNVIYSNL